jgi:hypothetical protein
MSIPLPIQRLLIAGGLLAVAVGVWYYFGREGFSMRSIPGMAPLVEASVERGDMNVAPSGPSPPAVAAPRNMPARMIPDPEPKDPYLEHNDDANAEENLRFPERSFSPGIVPNNTELAVQAGLANPATANSPQAIQQFSPEYATNGGAWLDNVSAAESGEANYSSF